MLSDYLWVVGSMRRTMATTKSTAESGAALRRSRAAVMRSRLLLAATRVTQLVRGGLLRITDQRK